MFEILKRVVAREDTDIAVGVLYHLFELRVDLGQSLVVRRGILLVGISVVRVDFGESAGDGTNDILHEDGIEPDMWVIELLCLILADLFNDGYGEVVLTGISEYLTVREEFKNELSSPNLLTG